MLPKSNFSRWNSIATHVSLWSCATGQGSDACGCSSPPSEIDDSTLSDLLAFRQVLPFAHVHFCNFPLIKLNMLFCCCFWRELFFNIFTAVASLNRANPCNCLDHLFSVLHEKSILSVFN